MLAARRYFGARRPVANEAAVEKTVGDKRAAHKLSLCDVSIAKWSAARLTPFSHLAVALIRHFRTFTAAAIEPRTVQLVSAMYASQPMRHSA